MAKSEFDIESLPTRFQKAASSSWTAYTLACAILLSLMIGKFMSLLRAKPGPSSNIRPFKQIASADNQSGLDARTPFVRNKYENNDVREQHHGATTMSCTGSKSCRRQTSMNPTVRRARVDHLMASMELENAIRQGRADLVVTLAEYKADCTDRLINAIRAIDPTYFDLPRTPCALHKECT